MYSVVSRVPRGRVATYGQVAELLGRPRGGREVGWTLHACGDPRLPCHRLVDRNGRLAPRFAGVGPIVQRDRLAREGVRSRGGLVDLDRYRWTPAMRTLAEIAAVTDRRPAVASPRSRGPSRRRRPP